jgi:menaquinone-dependent protoporphyrinogen IX oxidase
LKKVLVIYDSGYGATADAAETLSAALAEKGFTIDLRTAELEGMVGYDVAIIGSPIRLGRCTPKIKRFLRKNNAALSSMQIAYFFTCMSITENEVNQDLPLFIDPSFADSGKPRPRVQLMKNNHTASYYLRHFLKIAPGVSPLGISFFKGRLVMAKLSTVHRLIMRFAMFALPEIQNGDYLNHGCIRQWGEILSARIKVA